jgi:N-acetylglucosaminyldiphosphoundecaprenol N-acetyl-beta-D-mannosaminyltransferase
MTFPQPPGSDLPAVRVGGVRIHALTEAQSVEHILGQLDAGRGGWVVTVNLDHLRLFSRHPEYAGLCALASLTVADGMPLVWASSLQGTPLPERIAGSSLLWSLTAGAARSGRAVFLLGGSPGTAHGAALVLRQRYPALRVAGTHCPSAGFENDPQSISNLAARLSAAAPDIVYVGLGKPKQDLLINQLGARLPQTWFVGVGISFSFVCGAMLRAPAWMQRLGLEWLHRLAQEPRRLAARYLVHGVPMAAGLLSGAAIQRLRGSDDPHPRL